MLGDGLAEKFLTLLGAVAVECLGMALVIGTTTQPFDGCAADRAGHVANAHSDNVGLGMGFLKFRHLPCNLGEQVGG